MVVAKKSRAQMVQRKFPPALGWAAAAIPAAVGAPDGWSTRDEVLSKWRFLFPNGPSSHHLLQAHGREHNRSLLKPRTRLRRKYRLALPNALLEFARGFADCELRLVAEPRCSRCACNREQWH